MPAAARAAAPTSQGYVAGWSSKGRVGRPSCSAASASGADSESRTPPGADPDADVEGTEGEDEEGLEKAVDDAPPALTGGGEVTRTTGVLGAVQSAGRATPALASVSDTARRASAVEL